MLLNRLYSPDAVQMVKQLTLAQTLEMEEKSPAHTFSHYYLIIVLFIFVLMFYDCSSQVSLHILDSSEESRCPDTTR